MVRDNQPDEQDSTDLPNDDPFRDDPFEQTTFSLPRSYTSTDEFSGTQVRLVVSEVTMQRAQVASTFDNLYRVSDPENFLEFAIAEEYEIYADGDLVIDGGDPTRVSYLQDDLSPRVGAARKVKRRLVDAGFEPDTLDNMAARTEEAVVDFYNGINLHDAEVMARAIPFNASGDELVDDGEVPHTEDIREWVSESRESLQDALDALETLEDVARDTIGDEEYENATAPEDTDPADSVDVDGEDGSEPRTTDLEEIRNLLYEQGDSMSETNRRMFAERQDELNDGTTLVLDTGNLIHTVERVDANGNTEEVVRKTDSLAQAIQAYNETFNEYNL